jgi:hypothetical protein
MNSDHIESWQNYLVEQLYERHGLEKEEAQTSADRWLSSPEGHSTLAAGAASGRRNGMTLTRRGIRNLSHLSGVHSRAPGRTLQSVTR